jgi:hypothetical protein
MDTFGPGDAGAVFVFFCFGSIGAAGSTIAVLGVLPSWPFWFRLQLSFLLGTMLFGMWTIGLAASMADYRHAGSSTIWSGWTVAVFCYPLILLSIQAPLWLMGALGNWTIARQNEEPNRRPLTIRDMLTGMALIGFAMAGAQFARQVNPSVFSSEGEFWISVGGSALGCLVVSLLAVIPVVLATLRCSNPWVGIILLLIYGSAALAILFVTTRIMDGRFPGAREMFAAITVVSSFIVASSAPLLIARRLGCRLKWGRNPPQQALSPAQISAASSDAERVARPFSSNTNAAAARR